MPTKNSERGEKSRVLGWAAVVSRHAQAHAFHRLGSCPQILQSGGSGTRELSPPSPAAPPRSRAQAASDSRRKPAPKGRNLFRPLEGLPVSFSLASGRSPERKRAEPLRARLLVSHVVVKLLAAMRAAAGPLDELRRAGVFDVDSTWRRDMELVRQAMVDFEARFRLPEMTEVARLIAQFRMSPLSESLARYDEQTTSLQRAMENMRTPWLDIQEATRSVAGFAELQGIGRALESLPSFGDSLASA